MFASDHLKLSAVMKPFVFGTCKDEHLQCFIAGPVTHDLVPRGTHDALCDGVVPAMASDPRGANGVSAC